MLPVDQDMSFAGGTAVILSVTDIGTGADERALWADARITSDG